MLNLLLACVLTPLQPDFEPVWQIGARDRSGSEFALAPGSYERYAEDPLFVVGASKDRDWPYVLPGPGDSWAGSRKHTATVVFGLNRPEKESKVRVRIDLYETHASLPPVLSLTVNGRQVSRWQTPSGNGDEAIKGRPDSGRLSQWTVPVPVHSLKTGNNELEITSESGSWALFDSLALESDKPLSLCQVAPSVQFAEQGADAAVHKTASGSVRRLRIAATNLGPETEVRAVAPGASASWRLKPGKQTVNLDIADAPRARTLSIEITGEGVQQMLKARVEPVRSWTIYLIPHSHVDIGYTNLQPEVEVLHRNTLFQALELMEESKGLSPEAQYRWTVESTWVIDKFLQGASAAERARVFEAIKSGWMSVTGAYANMLSGLLRPEEMLRTFKEAILIGKLTGRPIDTVSQTDVPGMVWGIVPAMCQAGLKYLTFWPNPSDRIGGARHFWEDRPFYWVGPSGKDRVLTWPMATYALGHWAKGLPGGERFKTFRSADPTVRFLDSFLFERLADLERMRYPYNLVAFTWSLSDNCPVDGDLPQAVEAWNKRYASPRVVLATAGDAFHALESRYGPKIPTFRGDLSPYWEDGAGSSAQETALNRQTTERLVQAEALDAMLDRQGNGDPTADAWKNAMLYSEHTWGAYNSISEPDLPFVKDQWRIKSAFATDASRQTRQLLAGLLGHDVDDTSQPTPGGSFPRSVAIDVLNTSSWPRTGLATIPPDLVVPGDRVHDIEGRPVPSQRLKSGRLVALVSDVPALGSKRLCPGPGQPLVRGIVSVHGNRIVSPELEVEIDPADGTIKRIASKELGRNVVDERARHPLNVYLYLPGVDLDHLQTNPRPKIEVVEDGPLVAIVRVVSSAPGARSLVREIRVVAGLGQVEISNTVDKAPIRAKEGIHFAFPFDVPNGQMRIDNAWGVLRPEIDQLPGSNKNWLNVQRWVDVSNDRFGVTTAVLDAPLMEVGGITANLLGAVGNWQDWVQRLPKTQTFYSWAMNNHWHTNYRADQEGPVTFRYVVRPHGRYDPVDAAKFGIESSQPLLCKVGLVTPLLQLDNDRVLVSSLKRSDDGKAFMVRLWGASGKQQRVRLRWRKGEVGASWLSNLAEEQIERCPDEVAVPGWGIVTVRAERATR